VTGTQFERLVREIGIVVRVLAASRVVDLAQGDLQISHPCRSAAQKHASFLDSQPVQMIQHLASDARVEALVRPSKKIERRSPFAIRTLRLSRLADVFEVLANPFELQMHDSLGEAISNGSHEPSFFLQEGAFVLARHRLRIEDLYLADDLLLDLDVGRKDSFPRRSFCRTNDVIAIRDSGHADLGMLPTGRNSEHNLFKNTEEIPFCLAQNFLDFVEAVQLLGTLLQGSEELVSRGLGPRGDIGSLPRSCRITPRPARPSARMSSA